MRRLVVVISVLVLGGCATAAQRQAVISRDGLRAVVAETKACVTSVRNRPDFAPLIPHMPDLDTGEPTMAQLTDGAIPTPTEATLVASSYDAMLPCRSATLHGLSQVRPDLVPILADSYTTSAATIVLLVQRKITWGESARRGQTRLNDLRQALAAADREWVADLNASHQAEIAQRQAAGAALMQWSQQQQMINAINRPVVTNCNRYGALVNCVSN